MYYVRKIYEKKDGERGIGTYSEARDGFGGLVKGSSSSFIWTIGEYCRIDKEISERRKIIYSTYNEYIIVLSYGLPSVSCKSTLS